MPTRKMRGVPFRPLTAVRGPVDMLENLGFEVAGSVAERNLTL